MCAKSCGVCSKLFETIKLLVIDFIVRKRCLSRGPCVNKTILTQSSRPDRHCLSSSRFPFHDRQESLRDESNARLVCLDPRGKCRGGKLSIGILATWFTPTLEKCSNDYELNFLLTLVFNQQRTCNVIFNSRKGQRTNLKVPEPGGS